MGQMLIKLAENTELEVVSKVDVAEGFDREWSGEVEGVIDFSHHSAIVGAIGKAAEKGIAYVIGTTGLTEDEQRAVDEAAKKIPVVQSGNYSLGVNLLVELVRKAAAVLGEEYDIEITEMHHRHKKDAPSGTALMLARAAAVVRLEGALGHGSAPNRVSDRNARGHRVLGVKMGRFDGPRPPT
jgi:4-hydroxy-tetrahydrodipicolinate reductase